MLKPLLLKGKEDRIMKWFVMDEFRCRCCGSTGSPQATANSRALVEDVLDLAREKFGRPIKVNSGYRCPKHNAKVGGVPNSQHTRGEAADVTPLEPVSGSSTSEATESMTKIQDEVVRLARIIVANGKFDQLIVYPTFLHVSWKRQGGNRKQILRKTATGYQKVERL